MSVHRPLDVARLLRFLGCFLIFALLPTEFVRGQSPATILLSTEATPTAAEPNVTAVSVTGSGFPSGAIAPAAVTLHLTPVAPAAGPAMVAVVSTVTTLFGSSRRIAFQVAPANPLVNVQTPTNYQISVSGTSVGGVSFSSSNTAALIVNPPAKVQSVSPAVAAPGQTESATITGVFSTFFQGSTVVSFGPGISVGGAAAGAFGPVTVVSPTSATAQITASATASAGARDVDARTGSELASLPKGFSVLGASVLTQVSPNTGVQGQQNVSVVLTGRFTHFVQGATTASFGPGIAVASLTVSSATSAAAVLNINSTAAADARNVTVTTGAEGVTLADGFTVTDATPVLTRVTPSSGLQGQQNVSVVLTGQFTHFMQETSTVSFGAGITVVSLTVNSPTGTAVVVNISSTAAAGARNVTVTTGGESVTLANGFAVTNGTPVLTQVSPNSGAQGQQNISVRLTGQFTHFVQGTTTPSFGAGITVASLTVSSATSAAAVLNISVTAAAGTRNVTLTSGAEGVTLVNGFTVLNDTPALTRVSPTLGQQQNVISLPAGILTFDNPPLGLAPNAFSQGSPVGASSQLTNQFKSLGVIFSTFGGAPYASLIDLTGQAPSGTNGIGAVNSSGDVDYTRDIDIFMVVPGTTIPAVTDFVSIQGDEIPIPGNVLFSAYDIGGNLLASGIQPDSKGGLYSLSAPGIHELRLHSDSGTVAYDNLSFDVPAAPSALSVDLTGRFTHFVQGATTASFGPGVNVTSLTVTSATSATAILNVSAAAAIGARNVTVTTGTEVVTLIKGFTVIEGTPLLTRVSPNMGQQGQSNVSVALTGEFTHFVQGTTTAAFGDGITVAAITVNSATSATALLKISAAAAGVRTVTITSGAEVVTLPYVFIVTNATALLAQATPNTGPQGEQGVSVALTGQFTHFAQATTTASFGSGVAVASLTVGSATSATAVLNIGATAPAGARNVTLATAAEVVTLTDGFTVTTGIPALTQVSPKTGPQGQQNVSVVVTGQFTHFAQSTTTASFGPGIAVSSLTVNSATRATAVLNISATAAKGVRDVTVTTDAEVVTLAGSFTVTVPTPVLTQASPNTGRQGQQNLSVMLTGLSTHFVQGTATASFGAGISVVSLRVTSPTSATAVLNISATAILGTTNITVTTGAEIAQLASGFTISAGEPVLTSINPNSTRRGQTATSVALTGRSTHWVQGITTVNLGPGINVTRLAVTSGTSATAILNIPSTTSTGSTNVTVTTGTEVVTLTNGFTVGASSPVSFVVVPDSDLQGQTLNVTITAAGSHFVQGTTLARFGPSVMVGTGIAGNFGPVTVTSPTTATASLRILSSALPGPRIVTVQTGPDSLSGSAFTVNGVPTLISASLASASQGQQISTVVTGADTHFTPGVTEASFGPGVSVGGGVSGAPGPVTVTGTTTFIASLNVANGAALGLHTITAQTGAEVASNSHSFGVMGPRIGLPPTATITSPTEAQQVMGSITITGSIVSTNLSSWSLSYLQVGTTSPTVFAQGTGTVVSALLDTSVIMNGTVAITLGATDQSGQQGTATSNIVLKGNLKTGIFTETVLDLSLPVAGIPIQVTRTYDSRFKANGEFGFGWRLGLNTATISQNRLLGDGWTTVTSGGFLPTVCVVETQPHEVTVTLTDGTTYEFTPNLGGSGCSQLYTPLNVSVGFTSAGLTPANASLAVAGDNQPLVLGDQLIDLDTGGPFDPDRLILTLPTGQRLQISRAAGLQVVTDTNGNSLTVGPTGIFSSTGQSVAFTRDAQNRIQTVTDPKGNQLQYQYDDSGSLVSFTDASGNASSYGYDSAHHLISIGTPTGAQPLRNDFDANGKLVSHTDAFGNVINLSNDPNTRSEVVTDRNGNVTVNEYDSSGNIIKIVDAMEGVKRRTFDVNGNVLTITDQLGNTITRTYDEDNNKASETDALGNTTLYTYNNLNELLTLTDASGIKTISTYDSNGNLVSTTDALGKLTSYGYNAAGQRTSMTDRIGGVTRWAYDSAGNLLNVTDPLGHSGTYTYDANSNMTSATRTHTTTSEVQTLTTSVTYNSSNRANKTTYPDGSTTRVEYNPLGKAGVTIDQLGRQTIYIYDLTGRLTETKYADGTTESISYDANSNKSATTDRLGRVTAYSYDALNRLITTTYPDKSTLSKRYDAAGYLTSVTDALGNVTAYGHDAAGNETEATDALGNRTAYAYDKAGNLVISTDANGHATRYKYDPSNRRIGTTYADGTSDGLAFDALGHRTFTTDQGGMQTAYQYDASGELVQTTDAQGAVTRFTYDDVGNVISQADANDHVTTFTYDPLHRPSGRTLPGGQTEAMTYDAAGNLTSKTDFNSRTTTYSYDANNNWLVRKSPDASFAATAVSFAYTADGRRSSMTDASGVTNYGYDERNRLLQKATPEGTLKYKYDAAGDLLSIASSSANGILVSYSYDADKRLTSVTDGRLAAGVTNYGYDNAGNLRRYSYPNTVEADLQYDNLNRLTGTSLKKGSSVFESFAYTLGPAGTRAAVVERNGRTVNYGYDKDDHLTSEVIAGDPTSTNGSTAYAYDQVGNRLNRRSNLTGITTTSATYDADDRLNSETYDAAGNVVTGSGENNRYDFENRIIAVNGGAITIIYDGDGNRVAKTSAGVTTKYLVDDRNPSGYAQVLEELVGGTVQRTYTYGLQLISEGQSSDIRFYGYDGQGSVHQLFDKMGAVTDSYAYDAFGNLLSHVGSTANNYLYRGQQFDPDLGLYYLRARYMNANTGRFFSMDPLGGNRFDPPTLHRYLYAGADPVNRVDPSGKQELSEELAGLDALTSLIVDAIPSLRAAAFGVGAGGVFLNQIGAAAEDIADETAELAADAYPEAIEFINEQIAVVESSGGNRSIDFEVETGEGFVNFLVEVKSQLPTNPRAIERLVGQVDAALSRLTSSPTEVVIWTLKPPSVDDLAILEEALGANFGAVTVLSGSSQLYDFIVSML